MLTTSKTFSANPPRACTEREFHKGLESACDSFLLHTVVRNSDTPNDETSWNKTPPRDSRAVTSISPARYFRRCGLTFEPRGPTCPDQHPNRSLSGTVRVQLVPNQPQSLPERVHNNSRLCKKRNHERNPPQILPNLTTASFLRYCN